MSKSDLVPYVINNHERMFIMWCKTNNENVLLKVMNRHEAVDAIDLSSGSIPVGIVERVCDDAVIDEWSLEYIGSEKDPFMAGLFRFYRVKEES